MMNLINIFFQHPIFSSWFLLIIFIITYQILYGIHENYEKSLELKTLKLKNKKIFLDRVEKDFILDKKTQTYQNRNESVNGFVL